MEPIDFFWWSSQSTNCVGGNAGLGPPPTSAIMFDLKSISTMPIPPSISGDGSTLYERAVIWAAVIDSESVGESDSKAIL